MKNTSRNVGLFAIGLVAVMSWIGVMTYQLAPYVAEESGTTVSKSIPADNTTD